MQRFGTVIVFNEDISPEEIRQRLEKIADIVDPQYTAIDDATNLPALETFDDQHGSGPVWYCP